MRAPDAPPIDALGDLPGAHLGLTWSPVDRASLDEIVRLVRACEESDAAPVWTSSLVVERVYLPVSPAHVAMLGRDTRGAVRACAAVRFGGAGGYDAVALRAAIDPAWRGRGIGRAVLRWQDQWAREFLRRGGGERTVVGASIPSHLIDRRRLYTAAGFSCGARIDLYESPAGPVEERSPHVRGVLPADAAHLDALLTPADHAHILLSTALPLTEAIETADPRMSVVAVRGDTVQGAVLARGSGRPGIVDARTVILPADAPAGIADDLVTGLLGAAAHAPCVSVVAGTVATARSWREALMGAGFTPVGVELLYTIGQP